MSLERTLNFKHEADISYLQMHVIPKHHCYKSDSSQVTGSTCLTNLCVEAQGQRPQFCIHYRPPEGSAKLF